MTESINDIAIKLSVDAEGVIRVGRTRVTLDTVGEHVRIGVSDTGLGIPAEAIPNLGREFFRVKTPETREIVGTGLGLSVVKRILDAHHGRLEVASEESKGSTFTVLLTRLSNATVAQQA